MEAKATYRKPGEKFKVKSITEDHVFFENGYVLGHEHYPECCEYNYADFTSLNDTVFEDTVWDEISLQSDEDTVLVNGYVVNCYSVQNGYYTTAVDIVLYDEKGQEVLTLRGWGEWRG